jgi:hypothetical protein
MRRLHIKRVAFILEHLKTSVCGSNVPTRKYCELHTPASLPWHQLLADYLLLNYFTVYVRRMYSRVPLGVLGPTQR